MYLRVYSEPTEGVYNVHVIICQKNIDLQKYHKNFSRKSYKFLQILQFRNVDLAILAKGLPPPHKGTIAIFAKESFIVRFCSGGSRGSAAAYFSVKVGGSIKGGFCWQEYP